MHELSRRWMGKLQHVGMQVKPVRPLAIESVANNGAMQYQGMGGVHAQLVRTSR